MRVIIYTGKGGVGKTSMAAATACKIAGDGKKVLVMSTDQAHSLGDAFDRNIGKEPVEITERLYAMEIDAVHESEKSWGNLKDYVKQLLTARGGGGIEAEELLVFPGLEELFCMFQILEVYESGAYDTLIVDCAPTGETLALLKYPERLSGFIRKILPLKRVAVKTVGRVVEKATKMPMPKDTVFDDIEALMEKMKCLQRLLLDTKTMSLRLVTTPEKIVISETKRNFTCLYLYQYNVDAVIVNHIYPAKAMEGYFNKWICLQENALKEIRESFLEVPQFYVELQKQELYTLKALQRIGEQIFREYDPNDVLFTRKIYEVDRARNGLKIYLPFAEKSELILEQHGGEVAVGIRNEIRKFPIPAEFAKMRFLGQNLRMGICISDFETVF